MPTLYRITIDVDVNDDNETVRLARKAWVERNGGVGAFEAMVFITSVSDALCELVSLPEVHGFETVTTECEIAG